MKNSYIYNIIFTALFAIVVAGCSHKTETFDGPNLVDRFGPFNVVTDLGVSQPQVDFAAGQTVFFTAEFNKNVNWVIEITGTVSGAVKRIEGFDKSVNESISSVPNVPQIVPENKGRNACTSMCIKVTLCPIVPNSTSQTICGT